MKTMKVPTVPPEDTAISQPPTLTRKTPSCIAVFIDDFDGNGDLLNYDPSYYTDLHGRKVLIRFATVKRGKIVLNRHPHVIEEPTNAYEGYYLSVDAPAPL